MFQTKNNGAACYHGPVKAQLRTDAGLLACTTHLSTHRSLSRALVSPKMISGKLQKLRRQSLLASNFASWVWELRLFNLCPYQETIKMFSSVR